MEIYSFLIKLNVFLKKKKKKKYIKNLIKNGLKLGENVKIIDTFFFDPSHCYLISIEDNVTICPNVRLIAHDASTNNYFNYTKIAKIEIKKNCFLGDSTIVLPGITIGPNSIVGAGSVVTKSIAPNIVAAGNPAKKVCSLEEYLNKIKISSVGKKIFNEEFIINKLDDKKRMELINAVKDGGIGFIV
jgi:maltose O-acetyltransferase